jgi:hypothetical protein
MVLAALKETVMIERVIEEVEEVEEVEGVEEVELVS